MEQEITWEYIDALIRFTQNTFFVIRYSLVIINTNNIDFVNNRDDLDEVINYIRQLLRAPNFSTQLQQYNYAMVDIRFCYLCFNSPIVVTKGVPCN